LLVDKLFSITLIYLFKSSMFVCIWARSALCWPRFYSNSLRWLAKLLLIC